MSEFKGTPGPWVNVGGWVDSEKPGDLSSIICALASVAARNPEPVNDANANLIAAAPELLESLKCARLVIEKLTTHGSARTNCLAMIDAALLKVFGQ